MLNTDITDDPCTLLIDTQADISIMKENVTYEDLDLDTNDIIEITGVTDGVTCSLGNTTEANLLYKNLRIPQNFHIVPKNFNIGADGILGKDFSKTYKCNINYDTMILSFNFHNKIVEIPLMDGPDSDTIAIPARCEVVRKIKLTDCHDETRFINNQELAPGVMVARSIVDSKAPLVRIINTTNSVRVVKTNSVQSESISNFNIYNIDSTTENKTRIDTLLSEVEKHIPEYAKNKILPLCREFNDIFALETDKMTVNNFYQQTVKLKDDSPVYIKNYRQPHSQKEEIKRQVDKLLKNDLIEPSASEFNSPVLLVPKKGANNPKKWRLCIDYRLVNKKLIADKFPLPRIDDILDNLGRAKLFSVIDLFSGFHQIPIMGEKSRDITSFSTPDGSFRWKVVPFGLNVSPNSFSRMMAIAFSGIPAGTAFLYIDDIIVVGCSENHHLKNLRTVFETLRKYNLKINPYKCDFLKTEVTFLGHRCSEKGILPDSFKLKAIHEYPEPTDKGAVKRFVAFANYYRKFINNFASIAQPLNQLTRKKSDFIWTNECKQAFIQLKNALVAPQLLAYPDFNKKFIITVDASTRGCGAVLSQIQNGEDRPISFASRAFTKSERNKPIIELELLAIYFAIQYFKPYIYGKQFDVRSDHKPLIYLLNLKNPSSRLLRIRLELEEYNFTIQYIKGGDNVVADALSRISFDDLRNCHSTAHISVTTRSMSKKKAQMQQNYSNANSESEQTKSPMVYEDPNFIFSRKLPKVVTNNNKLCAYQNCKLLFELNISQKAEADKISLEKLFIQLQHTATSRNIHIVQWPMNDEFFKNYSIEHFKVVGNETFVLNLFICR